MTAGATAAWLTLIAALALYVIVGAIIGPPNRK